MSNNEVSYVLLKKNGLTPVSRMAIFLLTTESLALDFPNRSNSEIRRFVGNSGRSLVNPNLSLGKPMRGRTQAYARPLSVLAIKDGRPIAHLPIADNASSSRESAFEREAEIQAKLRVREICGKQLISKRYAWLGYAALCPSVRDAIATDPQKVTPLDVMVALALKTRDNRQPVAAYPWNEESDWRLELTSIGLEAQPEQGKHVHPFGPDSHPVSQERWLAGSVAAVQASILAKDRAELIISEAKIAGSI